MLEQRERLRAATALVRPRVRERRVVVAIVATAAEEVKLMRRWIEPFRRSFPDVHMEILTVVVEGEKVAAHFRCSGTHLGPWRDHEPSGVRFENVDELYFFRVTGGRLHSMVSVEDNQSRLSQLRL